MMTVDFERQEYKVATPIWQKSRDCVEGQEKIHEQGTLYLPKLGGQDTEDYNAYKLRALFYNATQRTVDALTGLLFRKDQVVEVPAAMEDWLDDVDLEGNSLNSFTEDLAEEIMTVGRYGLLVEYPQANFENEEGEKVIVTKAQQEQMNIQPFFVKYTAETIVNWRTTTVNNASVLSLVVLKEGYEKPVDEFETEILTRYRVLDLDPENGYYRQREFEDPSGKNNYIETSAVYPKLNGQNIVGEIPFIFFGAKSLSPNIEKAPILDLVNVNLSHYMTTADLEHGAHFTGLPTAVITGYKPSEGEQMRIGSQGAWIFPDPDAEAKYLEFEGKGLDSLEKRLEKKEQQMATLGARMLDQEKNVAETEDTHVLKRQGENSALASLAKVIEDGITKALKMAAQWLNVDGDIVYTINKDFLPNKMKAADLLALFQVWQGGGMSFVDFIENLKKGEVIDPEKPIDEIEAQIEASKPFIGGGDDEVGEIDNE